MIKDNKIKSLSHFDIIRKLHITLNDSIVATRFSYEHTYCVLSSVYDKCQVTIRSVELSFNFFMLIITKNGG